MVSWVLSSSSSCANLKSADLATESHWGELAVYEVSATITRLSDQGLQACLWDETKFVLCTVLLSLAIHVSEAERQRHLRLAERAFGI